MPMTNTAPASVTYFDGRRPKEPPAEDAIELHSSPTVRDWFVPVVAKAFGEARAALADVDVPPGCRPLDPYAALAMARECKARRSPAGDDELNFTLAFRPDGLYLCLVESIESIGITTGHQIDRASLVTRRLIPLPRPRLTRMGLQPATEDDEKALCVADAQAFAQWYVRDADGRTWRIGDSWLAELGSDAVVEALSAKTKRAIMREVNKHATMAPEILADNPVLIFEPSTGHCWGRWPPLNPQYIERTTDSFVRIRLVDDSPETIVLIQDQLDRIRIVGGKVVMA
jgi:hypothetical protein